MATIRAKELLEGLEYFADQMRQMLDIDDAYYSWCDSADMAIRELADELPDQHTCDVLEEIGLDPNMHYSVGELYELKQLIERWKSGVTMR